MASKVYPNCLNCCMGPILKVTRILGAPYVSISCTHTNNIAKTHVRVSKLCLCTSLTFITMLVLSSVYGAIHLLEELNILEEDLFNLILLIPGLSISSTSILMLIVFDLQAHYAITIIKKTELLISKWKELKSYILLPVEEIRRINNYTYLMLIFIYSITVASAIIVFCLDEHENWNLAEKIGAVVVIYIGYTIVCADLVLCICLQTLYSQVFICLKAELNFVKNNNKFSLYRHRNGNSNLQNSLSMYCQFYTVLCNIVRIADNYFNPNAMILFLTLLFMFVSAFYVVFLSIFENPYVLIHPRLLLIELQLGPMFILFAILLFTLQILWNGNDLVASFLYKYPINGLSREETLQVESLLKTLRCQKPEIKLSDITVVRAGLVATIFGIIVTYVLNILQFQLTLKKV